jgi:hypothetical protein
VGVNTTNISKETKLILLTLVLFGNCYILIIIIIIIYVIIAKIVKIFVFLKKSLAVTM